MLIPIEKVLSKDEVRQFRDVLARATWQDGSQTAGTLARMASYSKAATRPPKLARPCAHPAGIDSSSG